MKEPSEDDIEKIVLSIVKFISNVNLGSGFLSFIIAGSIVYLGLNACIAVIPYLQMISILTKLLFIILLVLLAYGSLYFLLKASLGYESSLLQDDEPIYDSEDSTLFCPRCNLHIHNNSRHCQICKQCILEWDHHCMWLGNCIGFRNIRYFILFLAYLGVYTWLVSICSMCYVYQSNHAVNSELPVTDMIILSLLIGPSIGSILLGISIVEYTSEIRKANSSIQQCKHALKRKWFLPLPFTPSYRNLL